MSTVRKVAVVGWGAIGRVVGTALAEGRVTGAELVRIVDNRPLGEAAPVRQATFEEAIDSCDLVVEAAGQGVVREWGERVLASGTDLLIASTGALTDDELAKRLLARPAPAGSTSRAAPSAGSTCSRRCAPSARSTRSG